MGLLSFQINPRNLVYLEAFLFKSKSRWKCSLSCYDPPKGQYNKSRKRDIITGKEETKLPIVQACDHLLEHIGD